MKKLKLDHDEMELLKKIVHKYSKDAEDEYYRLENTSITEEQRKDYNDEKEILCKIKEKLNKK